MFRKYIPCIDLSKENTNFLKSVFAIAVLAHHLFQHSGILRGTIFGTLLQALGYLSVSVFFFLSGYGLMTSYTKQPTYILSFVKNKILPFYLQCSVLILIYTLYRLLVGLSVSLKLFLRSFFFGGTLIMNGWYLQATLFMYILFFIAFSIKKSAHYQKAALILGFIVFFAICIFSEFAQTWYESILSFGVGILCAEKKHLESYSKKEKNRFFPTILLIAFIFSFSFVLGNINLLPTVIRITLKICSSISFALLVVFLAQKIPAEHLSRDKLHAISFEIYVSQGLFLHFFHSEIIYISNPCFYIILVVSSTLLFSILLHSSFSLIIRGTKRFDNKKKA